MKGLLSKETALKTRNLHKKYIHFLTLIHKSKNEATVKIPKNIIQNH